ncbi:MAG: hypothetical protein JXB85_17050 [Anaerolineales bacterium]|nr:hypothetical protein [Anaerolineales bacterium]
MKHRAVLIVWSLLALALLNAGCNSPAELLPFLNAATETPTNTPTPVPTATNTPMPTATSTPDHAATRAAQSTARAVQILEEFKEAMDDLDIATDTGQLGWAQEEPITIRLSGASDLAYERLADGLEASDFIIQTDIVWSTESMIQCGIIFRADARFDRGKHYEFWFLRFSGLPLWEISFWEGFEYIASSSNGARSSSAIDQRNNANNQITIVAVDNEFTVYINEIRQGRYFDYSDLADTGTFGVAGFQDARRSTCVYENTVIWVYR